MTAYEPPSSRRIVGAATCAMVESSRSITAAVITAPNATQRNLPLLRPAVPASAAWVVAVPAPSALLVSAG